MAARWPSGRHRVATDVAFCRHGWLVISRSRFIMVIFNPFSSPASASVFVSKKACSCDSRRAFPRSAPSRTKWTRKRAPVGNQISEAIFSRGWRASLTSRWWSPDVPRSPLMTLNGRVASLVYMSASGAKRAWLGFGGCSCLPQSNNLAALTVHRRSNVPTNRIARCLRRSWAARNWPPVQLLMLIKDIIVFL